MIRWIVAAGLCAGTAQAEMLTVVADIAPVQSLAARVMQGAGAPALLIPPGADPHDFALAPSDAQRLSRADLVIWVGPGLTPWLERPLTTLAVDAARLTLLETEGWPALAVRDGMNHGTEHDDHAGHDDHDHDHDDTHDHGSIDPHGWLSPEVAQHWVGAMAEALATADPAQAALYRQNAATVQRELAALQAELAPKLAGLGPFLLPHDAYQYFETAFDVQSAGAVTPADGVAAGPAWLAELRDRIAGAELTCILAPSGPAPGWLAVLGDGTDVRLGQIDDLGLGLEPGAGLYDSLIRRIADGLHDCAAPQ